MWAWMHTGTCVWVVWWRCGGEGVPGPALWARCTKDLSVLPGGIWLSVWAAPQSAGPSAQPPALSAHTYTHTLHQLCLNRIMTHTHKHAHTHARHQRPGKADLPLSWITDIHTTPCSQNNLIPLTPSRWVYNKAYVCVRFLSDSVWLIHGWNPQQVSSPPSHGFELHRSFVPLWRRKRKKEVKEKSPSVQVAVAHALFIGWKWIHGAFTGF